ncbi:MAG TPA: divalent-cation tolerance protein CutA [Thermoplasmata archaeon]|nr:divalent-cation tolerance protein CutA [Thermoplasmata archaeon]
MSPYPADPEWAVGPMRLVMTTYPSRERAAAAVEGAVGRRLAACGTMVAADSTYWWKGRLEEQAEVLVLFKTVPKRVGALFRYLEEHHPYAVPEIVELDIPRVAAPYLEYLTETLDRASLPPARVVRATRSAGRRARGARAPGRTRGPPHRRSKRTRTR